MGVDPPCFVVCVALSSAGEPVVLGEALGFCGGEAGLSCCDAAADAGLRAELDSLRISDAACAAIVKDVLCAVRRRFFLSFSSFISTFTFIYLPLPVYARVALNEYTDDWILYIRIVYVAEC